VPLIRKKKSFAPDFGVKTGLFSRQSRGEGILTHPVRPGALILAAILLLLSEAVPQAQTAAPSQEQPKTETIIVTAPSWLGD
jgi:hypothetical protein